MKKSFLISGICAVLFLLLIVVLKTVDVAAIGPAGTEVGLSGINGAVHESLGESHFWYQLTKILGFLSLATAAFFAAVGVMQFIRGRGRLSEVDRGLLYAVVLYAVTAVLYVLFDKVTINCRPVLEAGQSVPEPSFPSTHTLLVIVIMGSAVILIGRYVRNRMTRQLLQACCGVVIAVTVIGRLISGVHWLTDIIGGILLSLALLFLYKGMLERGKRRRS